MHSSKSILMISIIFILIISLISCIKFPEIEPPSSESNPELIFHTGFEENTRIVATSKKKIDDVVGMDKTLDKRNDWVSHLDNHPNIGEFRIYYEGGDRSQRFAKITTDPTDPNNKVMQFWLAEPNNSPEFTKGRIQADIYNNTGLKEIYQVVRMYLSPDMKTFEKFPGRIWWMMLFELWNNPSWDDIPYPFKISLHIKKPEKEVGTPLYFGLKASDLIDKDEEGSNRIWEATNTEVEVPIGQWVKVEIYIKEGNSQTGRFYMAITPEGGQKEVLFDITNFTHHPADPSPDGFSHFNPMKLYTSDDNINFMRSQGKVLEVFWDDYELWKDRLPEQVVKR